MFTYRRVTFFTLITFFFFLLTTTTAYVAPLWKQPAISPQGDGTGVAQWECWNDETLDPCHRNFYGVDGNRPTNIWTVGKNGAVFRSNGTDWNPVSFPNDQVNLYDVEVLADDSVWAVSGGLWHWDGASWQERGPSTIPSFALSMVSATDGWAVGDYGVIRHWNGTDFMTVTSPLTNTTPLNDIQMLSATEGWAVGNNGTILRYDGNMWVTVASPTLENLTTIDMRSATEGYAAGNNVFLRWNGTVWSIVQDAPGFSALEMVSPTEGYGYGYSVFGDQGIYRWDGMTWTLMYSDTSAYLQDMNLLSNGQIVGVGSASSILQYDNDEWYAVNMPQSEYLNTVAAISPTNVWAGGYNDTLLYYDGITWQGETYDSLPTSTVRRNFFDISFFGDTDGWAVGNDLMVRWDGNHWQEVDNNTEVYHVYETVATVSSTEAWVAGYSPDTQRSVIRRWDGLTWNDVPHPSATTLQTIVMLDSNTGMAGGFRRDPGPFGVDHSVVLVWDGSVWSEVDAPDISFVQELVLEDANTGWVLSTDKIVRLEEGNFTLFAPIGGRSISFSTPTNGWVVGRNGYRWDGTRWNFDQIFPQEARDSLLFTDGTGWAVGENGIIYYFEPPHMFYLPLIGYDE